MLYNFASQMKFCVTFIYTSSNAVRTKKKNMTHEFLLMLKIPLMKKKVSSQSKTKTVKCDVAVIHN